MKVNLDYGQPPLSEEQKNSGKKQLTNLELTEDYIAHAVNQKYPEGLKKPQRKIFGRIQRKLKDAKDNNLEEIELEEAEKDFIKDVFKEVSFPAVLSQFVVILEDEVEAM